jgi:hypothetical protein
VTRGIEPFEMVVEEVGNIAGRLRNSTSVDFVRTTGLASPL